MTTAQMRRSWSWLLPALFLKKVREIREEFKSIMNGLQELSAFIHLYSNEPIARAIETAKQIGDGGEWKIALLYPKIGFICLGLAKKGGNGDIRYWVDLFPERHFAGREKPFPNLRQGGYITLSFSALPRGMAFSSNPSDYLDIVNVR